MCNICLQSPCANRCPNASHPKIIEECAQCGVGLREDYEYYTDNEGNKFDVFECAIKYHGIKSIEPFC